MGRRYVIPLDQSWGVRPNKCAITDHDLDNPNNALAFETTDGIPRNTKTQISVYGGRGVLIESQGGPVSTRRRVRDDMSLVLIHGAGLVLGYCERAFRTV